MATKELSPDDRARLVRRMNALIESRDAAHDAMKEALNDLDIEGAKKHLTGYKSLEGRIDRIVKRLA